MDTEHYSQMWSSDPNSTKFQSWHLNSPNNNPDQSDEEKVLKELGKIVGAAKRRAPVIIGVAMAVTALLLYRLNQRPPVFKGVFQLLVEPVSSSENRLQSLLTQTEGSQRETINTKDFTLDYGTQIRVLQSPKVRGPITAKILEQYPKFNPDKIKVKRPFNESEGTRILEVSYSGSSEEEVEFVLNQFADGYLKYSLEDRQTNLTQAITFIEKQIPQLQERVDDLQEQKKMLRQRYDLMVPEFHSNKLVDQLRAVEMRRLDNNARLAEARLRYATVNNLFQEENYAAVLGEGAGMYGPLISQKHKIDVEVLDAAARMQEEHPTLKALREKQQQLQIPVRREAETILQKVKSELRALEDNDRILAETERRLKQQLQVLPAVARQYDDLQRELQIATESLNKNVAKLDGLRIDAAQQDVPWDLIAPPIAVQAPKAGRKTQLLTAIVGLVLGIGVGTLLEILNNVFHKPEEIEEDTRLPLLGVIPYSKKLKKLERQEATKPKKLIPIAVGSASSQTDSGTFTIANRVPAEHYHTSDKVLEAFRSLYAKIRLLSPDLAIHSLVIGAATPGEGKSTIAVHLAKTAAAIGQRVLLVDANMRSPQIHTKLRLPNLCGLSEAIASDISLNDAIQAAEDDNLFVLTAGSLPQDPIKLLSSKKMHSLMEQFQDFFDLVIYDTPPLVGLADGNILAAQTDGLVMVVKLDKTDRATVMKALDSFKMSGSAVLGVVANGVKG